MPHDLIVALPTAGRPPCGDGPLPCAALQWSRAAAKAARTVSPRALPPRPDRAPLPPLHPTRPLPRTACPMAEPPGQLRQSTQQGSDLSRSLGLWGGCLQGRAPGQPRNPPPAPPAARPPTRSRVPAQPSAKIAGRTWYARAPFGRPGSEHRQAGLPSPGSARRKPRRTISAASEPGSVHPMSALRRRWAFASSRISERAPAGTRRTRRLGPNRPAHRRATSSPRRTPPHGNAAEARNQAEGVATGARLVEPRSGPRPGR